MMIYSQQSRTERWVVLDDIQPTIMVESLGNRLGTNC
jgi:hypothetical protein